MIRHFENWFICRSGSHYHENLRDAELCCNGYTRVDGLGWIPDDRLKDSNVLRIRREAKARSIEHLVKARAARLERLKNEKLTTSKELTSKELKGGSKK